MFSKAELNEKTQALNDFMYAKLGVEDSFEGQFLKLTILQGLMAATFSVMADEDKMGHYLWLMANARNLEKGDK